MPATMAAMEMPMGMRQPYPPLPASPTLTNPDMILPDYDRASSPGLDEDRSQSPLMMWKTGHAAASGADLQHQLYAGPPSQHSFVAGPVTPTTPIIYGNGTMLSDIGEVTEVESTPGKSPSRRRSSPHRGLADRKSMVIDDRAMRSSPTMGLESGVKMRAKQQQASQERLRRSSIDSNSTITTQDQAGLFADFDDTVSVGDSVFQGDDEESVADSYVEESPVREVHPTARLAVVPNDVSGGSSGNNSGNEDRQSTASLSRRAEQILANAKRRLTTMEGNLSRARSSLYIANPNNLASFRSDTSTPSPPLPLPLRPATALRETREPSSPEYSPGHTRIGSENVLRGGLSAKAYPERSQSALGAAGGYRQPLTGSKSFDEMRDGFDSAGSNRSSYKISERPLEPLSEDEVSATLQPDGRAGAQLETFLSPTFGAFGEKGLVRSASAAQMRDLKDQMKDLKGKISSLREQARADSMKRRSLQSLRTPSPFTHAQVDQWYAEPTTPRETSAGTGSGRNPWNGELSSVEGDNLEDGGGARLGMDGDPTDEESVISGYDDVESTGTSTKLSHPNHQYTESPVLGDVVSRPGLIPRPPVDEDDVDDMQTEDGDAEEERVEEAEEGESDGTVLEEEGPETRQDVVEMEEMELDETLEEGAEAEEIEAVEEEEDVLAAEEAELEAERINGGVEATEAVEDDVAAEDETYESESGESYYHDSVQHQISHEDREDAFDYEHFILHSALGTISQQRLAGHTRRDSFSSEGSAETARGPATESISTRSRSRRASSSSTSTVESFATATEGRASRANRSSMESDRGAREDDYPEQVVTAPPLSAKKAAGFSPGISSINGVNGFSGMVKRNSAEEPRQTQQPPVARRPASSAATMLHRPSVSSFESTGTTRSFPLIGRKNTVSSTTGVLTPGSSSPDEELRTISETLLNETASVCERESNSGDANANTNGNAKVNGIGAGHKHSSSLGSSRSPSSLSKSDMATPAAMQMLLKEDQYLVERLVASLGRCVLGLTESGRASTESRMFRRRIDAARRILEGLEGV